MATPPRSAMFSPSVSRPLTCRSSTATQASYCLASLSVLALKRARSSSVHQFFRLPSASERLPWSSKPWVISWPITRADGAVVDRVVGRRIEKRRLQDAGRKDDLVERRIVIRVDRRRRHVPFVAIDRLAELRQPVAPLEGLGPRDVLHVRVGQDLQLRVIAPGLRISDLGHDGGQLGQSLPLGFVAHPVARYDALFVGGHQILDQSVHAALGVGLEVFFDVQASQRLADLPVHRADGPFPTRLHLLDAAHHFAEEAKVLVLERAVQVRGLGVHQVPAQVGAPVLGWDRREQLADGLKELRLADDHVVQSRWRQSS